MNKTSSDLDILRTATTYESLLRLCTYPSTRLIIYTKVYQELIELTKLSLLIHNERHRFKSCYHIIDKIMYLHVPFWSTLTVQDRYDIYDRFTELTRRRPLLHYVRCTLNQYRDKYIYWGLTLSNQNKRITTINECITECSNIMIWG